MSNNDCVQVALRIRPLVTSEIEKGCKGILVVYPEISQVRIKNTDKAFSYNYVFSPEASQAAVYTESVKPMIPNIFKGYNVTILAYGQTGSGKTHSMGTAYNGEGDMGVIPRAVADIFDFVKDNFTFDFMISVSFMELYQEILYDLLSDKPRDQCVLDIREDAAKSVMIPGLTELPVESVQDVLLALIRGSSGRATGSTNMNAQSSRSHAIFTINIAMQSKTNKAENRTAKFHLVDLAGSERQKKTGATGNTFREGININKGLLVLGNVISALGDEKQQHSYIPYRDSNLTRLLKDSLGGNSITLMIACVSPADYNVEETLSTLRYADRARKIQNKPVVNQDPKVAEINDLKKQIQQLKLQIVGQGGPMACPGELELLKKENQDHQKKIRDLTLQLSSSLNANTGLLEKVLILQTANENLTKKIQELKDEYDITLNNISIGIDKNDTESLKLNLSKLQKIREQFVDLDSEQKKTENEIRVHEANIHNTSQSGENNEAEMSKDQEMFTNQQIALNKELEDITRKLTLKEHLARQIATNAQYMVDYTALAENESKIQSLEKEKEELLQQLKNVQTHGPTGKIAEQRRKRVQELESHILELKKKVQEQARLIKMKERDEIKIKQLNSEILQMKQTKVKLIKQMREESDKFKAWKAQRERELAKLKQQDRKRQNQLVKMEAMHSKQQNVLKRKVEEAAALNKRLKDALALRKTAHDMKNGKVEKLGHWIKQEMQLYTHVVEAEATLSGLLEDRATLQEQLTKLKEDPQNLDDSQIKSIEEDIELRSVQIQDLQQKILDSDEENKARTRFDNIQAMSDAKFALKTLLEEAGEIKKKEVATKTKLIDAQAAQAELFDKIVKLEKTVGALEHKHAEELSAFQKEYEDKVAVLLRQLCRVEVQDADEELRQRCKIQSEKIDALDKDNQELMKKVSDYQEEIEEYKEKLTTIGKMSKDSKPPLLMLNNGGDFKTPSPVPKKARTIKAKKEGDSTFVIPENQENLDSSVDMEDDDVAKDPDWKKTPLGKYIMEKKRSTMAADATFRAPKRTSGGGCMCSKSKCSTKTCGCKKTGKTCTPECKCSSICVNKPSTSSKELKINDANVTKRSSDLHYKLDFAGVDDE